MTNRATETTGPDLAETASLAPAAGPATARLRLGTLAVLAALSIMVGGLLFQHRWRGLRHNRAGAEVAVTVAVNTHQRAHGDLLDYQIIAGHNHGPPTTIDDPRSTLHTYYVVAGNTPVLVHNCGGEVPLKFDGFNEARADAISKAGLGDDRVPFVQELGPFKGRVTGMQSPDGMRGWRIDFDPNDPNKGFHVNWWVKNGPKRSDGWSTGANIVRGGTEQDYWSVLEHFPSS